MEKFTTKINGKTIYTYTSINARVLIVQPIDDHDLSLLDNEVDAIVVATGDCFCLVGIKIDEWQEELSPWQASPVFGKQGFGTGAKLTLDFIESVLLPELKNNRIYNPAGMKCLLGGYSLAGLFALWAGYNTTVFDGVAAVSPSVWFPRWVDYATINTIGTPQVYLSLGDKEERTKNQVMAQVGKALRLTYSALNNQGVKTILEWNPGNHFYQPDVRIARGFAWLINNCLHDA
ncbi:MAG: esterase [Muribaculaceae bacterium]|nr:esterase [Muribaculaceae bacterium]MBQ2563645.1 esterase [Muribaculaceae bacterium]MDY6412981.1 alpha/beta hydrolase-fold protein [Bacteroidales bacterium]